MARDVFGPSPDVFGNGVDGGFGMSFGRAMFFGHSYVFGVGASIGAQRYSSKVARALNVEEVNYGVGGSAIAINDDTNTPNQPGGLLTLLAGAKPFNPTIANVSTMPRPLRQTQPYVPISDLFIFDWGANDLRFNSATVSQSIELMRHAFRRAITRARAGGLWEVEDANPPGTGTGWTFSPNTWPYWFSNGGAAWTKTLGNYLSIPIGADFPGGEVTVGLASGATAVGSPSGFAVHGEVNGVTVGSVDTRGLTGPKTGGLTGSLYTVLRCTNLAPGAQTLRVQLDAIDANCANVYFDCWEYTAPEHPLIVLVNQPHLPGPWTSSGSGVLHSPVTNADIDQLNTMLVQVAGEFDNVVVADVAAAFTTLNGSVASGQPGSLFGGDNVHPNDRGMGVVAETVIQTIFAAPKPSNIAIGPTLWRPIWNPAGATTPDSKESKLANGAEANLSANWQRFMPSGFWPIPSYCKLPSGLVLLRGAIQRVGAPAANEVIFSLPSGYIPSGNQNQIVRISGAAPSVGHVQIVNNGQVQWQDGDPTGWMDLGGTSFMADA